MTDVADPERTTMADPAEAPVSGVGAGPLATRRPGPTDPSGASVSLGSRWQYSGSVRS